MENVGIARPGQITQMIHTLITFSGDTTESSNLSKLVRNPCLFQGLEPFQKTSPHQHLITSHLQPRSNLPPLPR